MSNPSQAFNKFLEDYQAVLKTQESERAILKIHVDEVAAKIAQFYDKVRNVIDYTEEHLLRKHVIARSLKRRLLLKEIAPNFAEPLIKEIIRSGHLPNDSIPESKIAEVQKIIDNALFIFNFIRTNKFLNSESLSAWLIQIAVVAIEEALDPPMKDRLIFNLMFEIFRQRAVAPKDLEGVEENTLIFISIQKALLRADYDQLNYRIVKYLYPNFERMGEEELIKFAGDLSMLKSTIDGYMRHPFYQGFYALADRYNTPFFLLRDIIFEGADISEIRLKLEDIEKFEIQVRAAYKKRYKKERTVLAKMAILSVISFFITKIAVAVAIEVPVDLYLLHQYSLRNTMFSIIVPPILMLLIVLLVRSPGAKNISLILSEIRTIVYDEEKHEYAVPAIRKRTFVGRVFIGLVYIFLSIGILVAITKILLELDFTIPSIAVFIFFTSLVVATGVKIHHRSREISVEEEKASIIGFVADLVTIPFVHIGKVLLRVLQISIVNILIDFIIEMPMQSFIVLVENLRSFIKARKIEIQ